MEDVKIRKQENVIKLVDIGASNFGGFFKGGVLMACDEMCEKR